MKYSSLFSLSTRISRSTRPIGMVQAVEGVKSWHGECRQWQWNQTSEQKEEKMGIENVDTLKRIRDNNKNKE